MNTSAPKSSKNPSSPSAPPGFTAFIAAAQCCTFHLAPVVLQKNIFPACATKSRYPHLCATKNFSPLCSIFSPAPLLPCAPARLIPAVVLQNLVTSACVLQKEISPLSYKINPSPLSLTHHHALRPTHHAIRNTSHLP
jgi:hypothetical protein